MNTIDVSTTSTVTQRIQHDQDRLKELSGRIVGRMFYGTLLKSMRDGRQGGEIGHGGRGEEVFAEQLHGLLAERAGQATQGGVGDALYRHLKQQQERLSRQAQSVI